MPVISRGSFITLGQNHVTFWNHLQLFRADFVFLVLLVHLHCTEHHRELKLFEHWVGCIARMLTSTKFANVRENKDSCKSLRALGSENAKTFRQTGSVVKRKLSMCPWKLCRTSCKTSYWFSAFIVYTTSWWLCRTDIMVITDIDVILCCWMLAVSLRHCIMNYVPVYHNISAKTFPYKRLYPSHE